MKTIESTESAVFNALCDNGGNMSFNELMQDRQSLQVAGRSDLQPIYGFAVQTFPRRAERDVLCIKVVRHT